MLVLRDYQVSLTRALVGQPHRPGERRLVQLATGGGKTCVLNEFLNHMVRNGYRALIVTKDWTLLAQAARDFVERYNGLQSIGYVGEGQQARSLFEGIEKAGDRPVTYTTIHSWSNRADQLGPYDFVLIDELHWGEGAPLYMKLLEKYSSQSVFIGFTATPRKWTSFQIVDRAYDFAELLSRGYLAKPIIEEAQQTNVKWTPERSSAHGDFTQTSLRELATNPSRNRLIVKTYMANQAKYGKTLVFSCNIDHAEVLANMFQDRGIRAGVVHHKIENRKEVIQDFDASNLDVLVNVSMLTHGVDIPTIQTVFLARPTTSDILFSQMIGRGSRKTDVKTSFYIVDFVDNVTKYGVPIIRPDGFFGISRPKTGTLQTGPILERHWFKPAPFVTMPNLPGYEDIAGLDIQPEQTFGIEFEAGPRDGTTSIESTELTRVYNSLATALAGKVVIDRSLNDHTTWSLKRDSSCGIEITTRVLKGIDGFKEVYNALQVIQPLLDSIGYKVTVNTGTHVHFGWEGVPFGKLKNLLRIVAYYEPAIYSLVTPSRVANSYARSVRAFFKKYRTVGKTEWKREAGEHGHYLAVNYTALVQRERQGKTVEVRYHNGTLDPVKILTWVALWMRVLDRAYNETIYVGDPSKRLPRAPLCRGPRGNVLDLARFIGATHGLRVALAVRRHHVIKHSWVGHEKYGPLAAKLLPKWTGA